MRAILCIVLLGLAVGASARMYQWVNPTTGRVELSGTPPAWYRSERGGPRVQVFENGQMVDDTAIVLGAAQNDRLREAAFEELELRRQAEQIKRLERAARREAVRQIEPLPDAGDIQDSEPGSGQDGEPTVEELPDVLDEGMIDRLKNIIQAFDRQSGTAN